MGDRTLDGRHVESQLAFSDQFQTLDLDPVSDVWVDSEHIHANEAILERPEVQYVRPVDLLPTGVGRACWRAFGCPTKHIRKVPGILLKAPDDGDQLDVFLRGTG